MCINSVEQHFAKSDYPTPTPPPINTLLIKGDNEFKTFFLAKIIILIKTRAARLSRWLNVISVSLFMAMDDD